MRHLDLNATLRACCTFRSEPKAGPRDHGRAFLCVPGRRVELRDSELVAANSLLG